MGKLNDSTNRFMGFLVLVAITLQFILPKLGFYGYDKISLPIYLIVAIYLMVLA